MPPPPPAPEEPPMTELELLKFKQNRTTDDSLDSTRRMLQLCDETKEAGIKTLVALDDQGEQLENIEKGLTKINEDMKEADKLLSGLEKSIFWYVFCECCGTCELPCNKKSTKEDDKAWKNNDDGRVVSNQPQRKVDGPQLMAYGGYIGKITNDAREDEMEGNMEQVSAMIGNIRNMACDMGGEIDSQNQQLDRLHLKTESNEQRLKGANERARHLLK